MKKNDNLVIDKRRVREPEPEAETALEKAPGMSIAGQMALAEARPQPEFAVAPMVAADELQKIQETIKEFKIRCPRGWLLAKVLPPGEKIGLILLPEVCQRNADFAIVLEVGKGEFQNGIELPVDVKPGNHIMLPPYSGQEQKVLGADVLMIRQDEVQLIAGD